MSDTIKVKKIMKRTYQQPMTSAIEVQPLTILCASADMNKGTGYITGGGE